MHAPKTTREPIFTNETASEGKNARFSFNDQRPETAAQLKLQELADTGSQLQGSAQLQGVIQRVTADPHYEQHNYYKEVEASDHSNTDVDHLTTAERALLPIDDTAYNVLPDTVRTTHEEGSTIFDIEATESKDDWRLNTKVVKLYRVPGTTDHYIRKEGSFTLPVSCIEAAEHVIHYSRIGTGDIPDWTAGDNTKSVELHMNKTGLSNVNGKRQRTQANKSALDVSSETITKTKLTGFRDYDFTASALQLNEGLFVTDTDNPGTTFHAAVVVGINTVTGQFIVLERNAGTTTGDNTRIDNSWVLNAYDSPQAFKDSMGTAHAYTIGKLVAG